MVKKIHATKDQFLISFSHSNSKFPWKRYALMKLKEITNPTYPRYNIGGCIAKAGSCKTGFMSAPSIAPKGSILSNGFDVNSKNNKKPRIIKLNISKVVLFKGCLWWRELIKSMLQTVNNTIHRNIDPSWALQIELIL